MANEFIGLCVSINYADGSVIQGEVNGMLDKNETLILKRPFINGLPHTERELHLKASMIENLKIIKAQPENIQVFNDEKVKNNTIKIPVPKLMNNMKCRNQTKDVSVIALEQPKQNVVYHKERNDSCFDISLDTIMKEDFDFEKNLALFDKKAVHDEIHKNTGLDQHDKVSTTCKHNENILHSTPMKLRQVTVPLPGINEYTTDDGLVVPSITSELRSKLFDLVEENGLTSDRQNEIMGRAATEMVLKLLGGGYRFNPKNEHQCPRVVVLCGANKSGAVGINCARQLSSFGVHTIVVLSEPKLCISQLFNEIALYQLTAGTLITNAEELNSLLNPDFVVVSLADEQTDTVSENITNWAKSVRSSFMAINPPSHGTPSVVVKYSLIPALPLSYSESNGKIYLCNMGIPTQIFNLAGIQYKSPFGSKSVIPLHINK